MRSKLTSEIGLFPEDILASPHFLLETHPTECAALMGAFVRRVDAVHRDDRIR
jgi:hypothetical protein